MGIFVLVALQGTTSLRPIVGESNRFLNAKKKFFIFIGCLLVYGYVYLLPAYRLSKDFVISHALGWSDPRFANYHRLFIAIEPGMTRAEVELTIDAHYPEGGERMRPTHWSDTPQYLGLFLNPEHLREPNCEGISIHL